MRPTVPVCVPHFSPPTTVQARAPGGLSTGLTSHSQGQLFPTQLLLFLLPPAITPMEPTPHLPGTLGVTLSWLLVFSMPLRPFPMSWPRGHPVL